MKIPIKIKRLIGLLAAFSCIGPVQGTLSFEILYDPIDADFSAADREVIEDAINSWSELLTGYRDGVSRTLRISVSSFEQPFLPGGPTLFGSAIGSLRRITSEPVMGAPARLNGLFLYSSGGRMRLNVHPDAGPINAQVIQHEMAHVLGFGDLWEANELYNDGDGTNPFIIISFSPLVTDERVLEGGVVGEYRGENALREYRAEFDPTADFIPVELDSPQGSAHGHWNEPTDFPDGMENPGPEQDPGDEPTPTPVAISGPHVGESFADELMTSRRLNGSLYISRTTLGCFEDLGFTVDYTALESVVPPVEPSLQVAGIDADSGDVTLQIVVPLGLTMQVTQNDDLQGIWERVPGLADFVGVATVQTVVIPESAQQMSVLGRNFFRLESLVQP